MECVLENPSEQGLSWRHLSFCEYFAGVRLASLSREEQAEAIRQAQTVRIPESGKPSAEACYAPAQWQWVHRFALSKAQSTGDAAALSGLAADLIRYGDPFVLYDAIDQDNLTVDEKLDRLCRWLVHRDSDPSSDQNYSGAWNDKEWDRPTVDDDVLSILETLFDRENRNSRCLHAAWELLENADTAEARALQERFLREFHAMDSEVARQLQESAFVRCPADPNEDYVPFNMGSTRGDEDEEPVHPVVVSPFLMQPTAVSNEQFELFDPSHFVLRDEYSEGDDCPVIYVSWYMAEMFCKWLGAGYRLPTEAEWEYACRAGTTTEFCNGNSLSSEQANFDGNYPYGDVKKGPFLRRTTAVGSYEPNAWGLRDVHGNAWEWCHDWHASDYYQTLVNANGKRSAENPHGPSASSSRVVRGGSWYGIASGCRSAIRGTLGPRLRDDDIGFRVLLSR